MQLRAMPFRAFAATLALASLTGCAGLFPPPPQPSPTCLW